MASQNTKVRGKAPLMPIEPANTSNQPEETTPAVLTPNSSASAVPEGNKTASGLHNTDLEHRTPGTYDPWFENYGWKGFLDWNTLREDAPTDRWILGSAWPGLPQRSPRSEARSMAQVRELLAHPPKRVTSPQSQRRKNERIAIFETRAQRDARLERLAANDEWTGHGQTTTVAAEDQSNGRGEREQKGEFSSNFVVRKEKRSLFTHKPGERAFASPTGPATAIRAVGGLLDVAAPPSTSAAITGQVGDKPKHGLHQRQKSSLSAAAPVFRNQGLLNSPTATASPPYSTASVSYQQPHLPFDNPYRPSRYSTQEDNTLHQINRGYWPSDTRSRRQKRAAYRQQQSAQAQTGAQNSTQTQQQPLPPPRATAAPYIPPFRQVEQGTSSAAAPASSDIPNPPPARPVARLPPPAPTVSATAQQPMGSFSAATALPRPIRPASGSRLANPGQR